MKGQCYLRKQCNIPRCAKSGIASTYTYKNIYKNKFERKVPGIGGWGGSCRCPNGQVYQVGDSGKGCTALACINGKPGKCNRKQSAAWAGNKVTCATAILPTTPTAPPTPPPTPPRTRSPTSPPPPPPTTSPPSPSPTFPAAGQWTTHSNKNCYPPRDAVGLSSSLGRMVRSYAHFAAA